MDPYNTLDTRKREADLIDCPWSAERVKTDRSNKPCFPPQPQPTKLHTKKRS